MNYAENYERIFGKSRPERGRFRQDPETKELLPIHEWAKKYGTSKSRAPMVIVKQFEPFVSPVTDQVISNRRQHQYDLDASGCRVYEGREQEEKEAARFRNYEDKKLQSRIDETLNQTAYDIEHGYQEVNE